MSVVDSQIVERFKDLGMNASFHYADDSGREWGQGDRLVQQALSLYDNHPDLHNDFKEVARGFLWSLSMELDARESRRSRGIE